MKPKKLDGRYQVVIRDTGKKIDYRIWGYGNLFIALSFGLSWIISLSPFTLTGYSIAGAASSLMIGIFFILFSLEDVEVNSVKTVEEVWKL